MTEARRVVVRYTTKPECADENQKLVEAVFAALAERRPEGFRYATFRLDDGVSFVHVASLETDEGNNPLDSLPQFAAFTKDIAARCEQPPAAQPATLVGSYRIYEDR
jgi:hypothetical protein